MSIEHAKQLMNTPDKTRVLDKAYEIYMEMKRNR